MRRPMRAAAVTLLATALAVFPLALDRCAASCEARDRVASSPICHHTQGATARLGHPHLPCGHDHDGAVVAAADRATTAARRPGNVVAAPVFPTPAVGDAAFERYLMTHAPPGDRPAIDTRLVHLRI